MGHDQYWPPLIRDPLRTRHRADGLQCRVISPPPPTPLILGADVCPYSRWGHEAREVRMLTRGPAGRKLRQENPSRHLRSMPLALLLG